MIISKLYDWTIRLEGLCQSVNDLNAIFLIRFKNVFIYLSTVEDMSNSHVCMLGLRFVYVCAGGGGVGWRECHKCCKNFQPQPHCCYLLQ